MNGIGDFQRQTVSKSVARKGERLYRNDLVIHGPDPHSFRVKGDHGFYRVQVLSVSTFGVIGSCSCPAYRVCSHLYAATLYAIQRDGIDVSPTEIDFDAIRRTS